jgi:signal peptidase II
MPSRMVRMILVVVMALVIGGGNLLDRLARNGRVTDFINLGIDGIRTGIFNFADVFLLAGILYMLSTLIDFFARG